MQDSTTIAEPWGCPSTANGRRSHAEQQRPAIASVLGGTAAGILDLRGAAEWNDHGVRLTAAGALREAVAAYEKALWLRPAFPEAFNNLGVALTRLGELERAIPCFERAIAHCPTYAEAFNNLGFALASRNRTQEAAAALELAVRLKPDYAEAWNNLGILRHLASDLVRAVDCYRQALRCRPNYVDASSNLAAALKEQGLLSDSVALFQETLRHQPGHALALYNLSQFAAEGRYEFSPDELARMRALVGAGSGSALDRSLLCYTLGSVMDRRGAWDEAFSWFRRANELRRQHDRDRNQAFDLAGHRAQVDGIIRTFAPTFFRQVDGWGDDTEVPIFIVGMPRSGSTLVEHILASHSEVFGAGEVGEAPQAVADAVARAARNGRLTGSIQLADCNTARNLARTCADHLRRLAGGSARMTIKSLENVWHLGTLAMLFPRARVIHCRRDPLDIGLSCYFQNFQGLSFTSSLEDIGGYFLEYKRVTAHWRQVLPLPVHEVCYEELVRDPETVTRSLLAFCGLSWQESCRNFFKSERPVRTASTLQVRKPITTASVGRWRRYQAHLTPLIRALGAKAEM
jgi:tetratricopeptide (TPR) repeat protein